MRIIDAQAYCKELILERDYPNRSEEFKSAIEVAIADLGDIPTIEAEPVKHGEWVWDSDNDRYVCSRCNKEPSGDCNGGCVSHLSDYCPNCGARMDGGEK